MNSTVYNPIILLGQIYQRPRRQIMDVVVVWKMRRPIVIVKHGKFNTNYKGISGVFMGQ